MILISWSSREIQAETLRYSGLNHISTFWIQHGGRSAYAFESCYRVYERDIQLKVGSHCRWTENCTVLHVWDDVGSSQVSRLRIVAQTIECDWRNSPQPRQDSQPTCLRLHHLPVIILVMSSTRVCMCCLCCLCRDVGGGGGGELHGTVAHFTRRAIMEFTQYRPLKQMVLNVSASPLCTLQT
jgi:hypothetical protein